MEHYTTLCHVCLWCSVFQRKILTFFSLSNVFTKRINRVAIHTIFLHLVGQILGKMQINFPHPYCGYIHQQQIFQQKICPLMVQALDTDFWTTRGTQLQVGKGSYIVSYFDDDDDGEKEKLIPVLIVATGTISRSFRKYLSNRSGKHEIKGVQKKKYIHIGHYTHT